jgi:HPt (histidine-containing phosphotransfer) domain-containing protein
VAYDYSGLDWGLASALGDDTALVAELRKALVDDAKVAEDLLRRSRCDANWMAAAHRLKGLAASFGARSLLEAANIAIEYAPGDPVALRQIERAIAQLSQGLARQD